MNCGFIKNKNLAQRHKFTGIMTHKIRGKDQSDASTGQKKSQDFQ